MWWMYYGCPSVKILESFYVSGSQQDPDFTLEIK